MIRLQIIVRVSAANGIFGRITLTAKGFDNATFALSRLSLAFIKIFVNKVFKASAGAPPAVLD